MRDRYSKTLAALAAALLLFTSAPAAVAQKKAKASGATAEEVDTTKDFYSCPMHPEVKSKKKGTCPKCKMDLRLTHPEPKQPAEESGMTMEEPAAEGAHVAHAPSKIDIADVELLDQDGRKVHFYTDLVKGKTVAIQFIFTTCTTICPPLGATFSRVQRDLGERAGRDVQLISVSVDPATDTPERMKAWGAKFKAGAGWTLVTGPKPQVDELLRSLGASVSSPAEHSAAVIVGNDAKGQWKRTYGLATPSILIKLIGDAYEGRLDTSADTNAKEQAQQ
jgi:cytochrome oxidase Cu insertion factor (SCO1/SenC/PrrC family)